MPFYEIIRNHVQNSLYLCAQQLVVNVVFTKESKLDHTRRGIASLEIILLLSKKILAKFGVNLNQAYFLIILLEFEDLIAKLKYISLCMVVKVCELICQLYSLNFAAIVIF